MVRPFQLSDIPLLTRLEKSGVPLYNEVALTHGLHPWRSALAGYLSLHRHGLHTCVLPASQAGGGFAQMWPRQERGVMTYIAPALSGNEPGAVWVELLEAMAVVAGKLGLQYLIAEVPGESPAIDVLRHAGFSIYLRQDILRCVPGPACSEKLTDPTLLHKASPSDEWAVQQLYYNITPRLAQLASFVPEIKPASQVYIAQDAGEVTTYLEIRPGALGAWFDVMVHPQAEVHAQHALIHGLALMGQQSERALYCCVRRYQEWLWEPLLALGFEAFASSAVMVKRLVAPVTEPELSPVAALEARQAASPVARAATSDPLRATSRAGE
ncbi:MAG: hypothetical protein JW850_19405 [Thermoflexales bacterium]|nr:hypothetical protein [Thermoflexales bacterium]